MRRALVLAAILFAFPLAAQTVATDTKPPVGFTKAIDLWPEGAPLSLRRGVNATEGDIPKLFTYPAAGAGPHPAVIVFPGGGYTHLVIDQEGGLEAQWLAAHGVTAFVAEYRLSPAYRFPAPMLDGSRAVRYVRGHAAELGVDPHRLGVWGFSAGGHLAAYLSVVHTSNYPIVMGAGRIDAADTVYDRPDFTIISYGRMDLSPAVPRPAVTPTTPAMETVLGATTAQLDIVSRVPADAPPTLIYSTSGDQTVDSRNATDYYNALKAAGVAAELHVFELGPHGTHMGTDRPAAEHELAVFPLLLTNWMQQHGWMPGQPQL